MSAGGCTAVGWTMGAHPNGRLRDRGTSAAGTASRGGRGAGINGPGELPLFESLVVFAMVGRSDAYLRTRAARRGGGPSR